MKTSEFAKIISDEFDVDYNDVLKVAKNRKELYKLLKNKKDYKEFIKKIFYKETITLTLGDCGENHKGMQMIGKMSERGFSKKDLEGAKKYFEKKGVKCELIDLSTDFYKGEACILIIRGGVKVFCDTEELYKEMISFEWDKKAKMYGRVVNKHARHNVCFSEESQVANYEEGKGTIIAYKDVPLLENIKNSLAKIINGAEDLKCEGNRYYDNTVNGISSHGDAERRKVIAIRLGGSMNLCYQWYLNSEKVYKKYTFILNNGDMYIMSEKAVGTDWKLKNTYTLRHSAGCKKYTS